MRFIVTLRDPEALDRDLMRAVVYEVDSSGVADDEIMDATRERYEDLWKKLGRWFEHGETIQIEIDTETLSFTILECAK